MPRELFLTFDTEDFITENSIWALHEILKILKRYDLKALFFITGSMAERLQDFPPIVELLNDHEIGYHSSGHSIHPTIFEFTDIDNYEEAYRISIHRETAHIDPLTGNANGVGGINALRRLFPKKQITAFRAPGHCWSPPHLEALRSLGIKYDFSANLSAVPVNYKNITFYPYPIIGTWRGEWSDYEVLLFSLLRRRTLVMSEHPSLLVNQEEWDLIYMGSNPTEIVRPHRRNLQEIESLLRSSSLLFRQVATLQKTKLINITPQLRRSPVGLKLTKSQVESCYQTSVRWAARHKYEPRFLHRHFFQFFEIDLLSH